jgi:hypothetical protein
MSQVYCWECEKSYATDEILDIPVFKKGGNTIQWCLNCVSKQLKWTDYKLVKRTNKEKESNILSIEEKSNLHWIMILELELCLREQYGKNRIVSLDELEYIVKEEIYEGN